MANTNSELTQEPRPQTPQLLLLDGQSRSISFQALLTNELGNPIADPNGEHELDFRLYSNAGGGIPVGEVLDVLVTLNGGVASTSVGPIDPAWFDGSARWMGVTVDNGTELTPLIALGSVPYAFRVDRVASVELDDAIDLGDPSTSGSLSVFSGDVTPVTIELDGSAADLHVRSPNAAGRMTIHGTNQLIETRDNNGMLVALYGFDAGSGGAASLLGTAGGTTGLLLDGHANGSEGGLVQLFNAATDEAITLSAANATIRAGSINGGVAGNVHLHPAVGGGSRIHLDGETADVRLGLSLQSSGDLRTFSSGGGIETIHLNGGTGQLSLTDRFQTTVLLDGDATGGGGLAQFRNGDGDLTAEIDGDEMNHGALRLWDALGINTVEIEARESGGSTGAQIRLRDAGGIPTIVLDAEFGVDGGGLITASRAVGIGLLNPNHELVVQANDPTVQIRDDFADNSANAAKLELLEKAGGAFDGGAFFLWDGSTNKLHIGTQVSGTDTSVMVIDRATGGVGIGTETPGNHRLAVNGSIRAKEIVVETGWADFVFEEDYKLASLDEVEAHIGEHGHLPDIPSADDVAKNGVRVGEMESKLLQKVEELTLHLIDMNKRLRTLEEENSKLRNETSQSQTHSKGGV